MRCPSRFPSKKSQPPSLPPAAWHCSKDSEAIALRARLYHFLSVFIASVFAVRAAIGCHQRCGHRSRRRSHPQREVTVTNTAQGTALKAKTNSAGEYSVPALEAGTYSLQVTAPGFQKFEATGIVLRVARTERVDAKLAVGAVTSEVKVSALNWAPCKRSRPRYRSPSLESRSRSWS